MKSVALVIDGDNQPIMFSSEDELLKHIMDTQAHKNPHERCVPEDYVMAFAANMDGSITWRDREWLEEQFNELNGNAGQAHNEEYEARYGS